MEPIAKQGITSPVGWHRFPRADGHRAKPQAGEFRVPQRRRAARVFRCLVGIVICLALPILTDRNHSAAQTQQSQPDQHARQIADLDVAAARLAQDTAKALAARDHWYRRDSGTTSTLDHIAMAADGTGVIIGDEGTVLHTRDRGATWSDVTPLGLTKSLRRIWMSADGSGVIVGGDRLTGDLEQTPFLGVVLHTTDRGAHWSNVTPPGAKIKFPNVAMMADGSGVIVGCCNREPNTSVVLHTTDRGATWSIVTPPVLSANLYRVALASDGSGVIVGGGVILHSRDRGASWSDVTPPGGTEQLTNAVLRADGVGLVVGRDGTLLRTTDHGASWENRAPKGILENPAPMGMRKALFDVTLAPDGIGMIVGDERVLYTNDHGASWTDVTPPVPSATFTHISMAADGSGVITGIGGRDGRDEYSVLLFTTNRGASWTDVTPKGGTDVFLSAAMAVDGSGVVPGLTGTTLLTTTNRGADWSVVTFDSRLKGRRIYLNAAMASGGWGVVVGTDGLILARLPELTAAVAAATSIDALRVALDALPAQDREGPDQALRLLEAQRDSLLRPQ